MRVVHVTCRYYPNIGGVEALVKELNDKLVEKGCSIAVYAFDRNNAFPKKQYIDGVLVRRYKPIVGDPLYLPPAEFLKDIRSDPSTILHVHDVHSLLILITALSKRSDQKMLLQLHYHRFGESVLRCFFFRAYKRLLNLIVFPRAAGTIVNSRYEERIIKEDFSNCKRITLLPESLPIKELESVQWKPDSPKRILYVGSLRKYKNVDKLLHAFSLVHQSQEEELKLAIIGDGPERNRLTSLANKLGINAHVEWKHHLSRRELLSEYSRAQVFVLLSPLESFSRVVHEALIIGLPTIVLNLGATAELVKDGLLKGVDSTRKEELAHAINEALKIKKAEVSFGHLASSDVDQYSNEFIMLYKSMLSGDYV